MPEVAQLGCLLGPEAAQLASPLGQKQKRLGQSYCVNPGVGRHRHVKVRMGAFLFFFFARTPQNTAKRYENRQNRTQWYDILGKVRGTKDQPTDQRIRDNMFGPVSFRR